MFWRNVNLPGPFSIVRKSIVGRLTALYTLLGFAMFLLAAAFLHWALASNFRKDDERFLADKVQLLRTILAQNSAGTDDLKEEVEWETAALHFARYYARVLDANGNTLMESPEMSRALPARLFATPSADASLESQVTRREMGIRDFLLLSANAGSGDHERRIEVALDVTREDAFLQDYRRNLAWAVAFGVLVSAIMGGWAARRGLRPLAELARATDRISASQLHERIAGRHWPRELAALARGFDRMLDRLEDSFKRLSQFSGDMAHELRTPINNLRGEAGVALSQSRTAAEYRRTLESSLEEFARLSALIDNLLFLARADSPTGAVDRKTFDAREAIESLREFYDALAEDRRVAVYCDGNGRANADPTLFRQAVSNLLSNALNHTPPGGSVNIRSEQRADGGLDVIVADSGCGIPAEHLPHVFDRLYRADPARSHHPNGAGLGLAIVKSIVELHGGSVNMKSAIGKGTTVTLNFPPGAAPNTRA